MPPSFFECVNAWQTAAQPSVSMALSYSYCVFLFCIISAADAGEPMPNYTLTSQHLRLRKGVYPIEIEGPGNGRPKPVMRTMMWVGASPEGLERIKMYGSRDNFGEFAKLILL